MQVSTTVKTAFLVRNSIGKVARLINTDTKHYLSIQKAIKKVLEPFIAELKVIEEKNEAVVEEFRARQREINMSSKTNEQKDSEVKGLMAEMGIAIKPLEKETEDFDARIAKEPIEIEFDRNDFTWLKAHIEKNAMELTKNQDGSANTDALEMLYSFIE